MQAEVINQPSGSRCPDTVRPSSLHCILEGKGSVSLAHRSMSRASPCAHDSTGPQCLRVEWMTFPGRSERAWKLTSYRGQRIQVQACEGIPVVLLDVSAAASCIPELRQCPAARRSAPTEVSPRDPVPTRCQPSASGTDGLCPGHKPAPAQRIECDINPGNCPHACVLSPHHLLQVLAIVSVRTQAICFRLLSLSLGPSCSSWSLRFPAKPFPFSHYHLLKATSDLAIWQALESNGIKKCRTPASRRSHDTASPQPSVFAPGLGDPVNSPQAPAVCQPQGDKDE